MPLRLQALPRRTAQGPSGRLPRKTEEDSQGRTGDNLLRDPRRGEGCHQVPGEDDQDRPASAKEERDKPPDTPEPGMPLQDSGGQADPRGGASIPGNWRCSEIPPCFLSFYRVWERVLSHRQDLAQVLLPDVQSTAELVRVTYWPGSFSSSQPQSLSARAVVVRYIDLGEHVHQVLQPGRVEGQADGRGCLAAAPQLHGLGLPWSSFRTGAKHGLERR